MTNRQLIERLRRLPLDAEIVKDVSSGACNECNPEGIPYCLEPCPTHYHDRPYPYHMEKGDMIIL